MTGTPRTGFRAGGGGGGSGDTTGPASSTDNAIARYDGATGKILQDSAGIIDDAGALTGITVNANVVTAGTLVHERGGLEADVSAYGGLVKISGGVTSQAVSGTDYAAPGTERRPSFDNPPSSPHAYNDEFDSTTLDTGKWTAGGGQTATAGTIAPTSTLSSASKYDLASWPSWLLFQGHNATVQTGTFTQSVTLDTNATFFLKVAFQSRGWSGGATQLATTNENLSGLTLANSADSNESISFRASNNGTNPILEAGVLNNGAFTSITSAAPLAGMSATSMYLAVFKATDTYYFYVFYADGGSNYLGSLTKTGVTTFDELRLSFSTSDDTISPIAGIDFIRYYSSVTFALMNS